MLNYAKIVKDLIEVQPGNLLLEAAVLYESVRETVPETSFYKTMERLSKSGELVHLTKGIYYRPKKSRFGLVPLSDNDIVRYYTKEGKGIVVGYKMYNHYGITTQIGKGTRVYSCTLPGVQKNIGTVSVNRIYCEINFETIPVIETLEILQNYSKIEDLNKKALIAYMEKFAEKYSNNAVEYVLENIRYKKSTIAFLRAFLNYLNVPNTLEKYLSSMSNYSIPRMEELYESARA